MLSQYGNVLKRYKGLDKPVSILFSITLACVVAVTMRFWDVTSNGGNVYADGAPGYVSSSSSMPRDEKHYIKPLALKTALGTSVIDPAAAFDYSTPLAAPLPTLVYNALRFVFGSDPQIIRSFNALTIIPILFLFFLLASRINIPLPMLAAAMICLATDFLFFSYNRLAHLESLSTLFMMACVFLFTMSCDCESRKKSAIALFLTGLSAGALAATKVLLGSIFGIAFICAAVVSARGNVTLLLQQGLIISCGAIGAILAVIGASDFPLSFFVTYHFGEVVAQAYIKSDIFASTSAIFNFFFAGAAFSNFALFFGEYFKISPISASALVTTTVLSLLIIKNLGKDLTEDFIVVCLSLVCFFYLVWFFFADYLPPRYYSHLSFFSILLICHHSYNERYPLTCRYLLPAIFIFFAFVFASSALLPSESALELGALLIVVILVIAYFLAISGPPDRLLPVILLIAVSFNSYQFYFRFLQFRYYDWYEELSAVAGRDSPSKDIRVLNGVSHLSDDFLSSLVQHARALATSPVVSITNDMILLNRMEKALPTFEFVTALDSRACLHLSPVHEYPDGVREPEYSGTGMRIIYSYELISREQALDLIPKFGHG